MRYQLSYWLNQVRKWWVYSSKQCGLFFKPSDGINPSNSWETISTNWQLWSESRMKGWKVQIGVKFHWKLFPESLSLFGELCLPSPLSCFWKARIIPSESPNWISNNLSTKCSFSLTTPLTKTWQSCNLHIGSLSRFFQCCCVLHGRNARRLCWIRCRSTIISSRFW